MSLSSTTSARGWVSPERVPLGAASGAATAALATGRPMAAVGPLVAIAGQPGLVGEIIEPAR
ncbi:hypothetical protein [Pseudofrankia saprophytica]|uniref:hypothetical protein n=1 Tax=Pseudofrankia saprophytica TaxID=298655 RepID=UPI00031B5A15|nr:hypothetical protein [Pseudofrankia saprophytica]